MFLDASLKVQQKELILDFFKISKVCSRQKKSLSRQVNLRIHRPHHANKYTNTHRIPCLNTILQLLLFIYCYYWFSRESDFTVYCLTHTPRVKVDPESVSFSWSCSASSKKNSKKHWKKNHLHHLHTPYSKALSPQFCIYAWHL